MPIYDYHCSACNETWEDVLKMADRKLPEISPCPKCNVRGQVEQSIVNTNLGMSYSLETSRAMKSLGRSKFQEKLSEIHANTPGSLLDKSSTITPISK